MTLPVFKDSRFLKRAVESLEELTPKISKNFILLIAEDGSNSYEMVCDLTRKYPNLTYFQYDQRLGRGRALREAWNRVEGDVYVYIDVDLATDLLKFDAYRNLIERQADFDLVAGSRYMRGSSTERPKLRRYASLAYNWLIRILFHTGVHDHQCGFKSFSRELVKLLGAEAKNDSWFWDTEVIVLAKKFGFRICEIPIHWRERKGYKTPVARLMKDIWLHGSGLVKLLVRVYLRGE